MPVRRRWLIFALLSVFPLAYWLHAHLTFPSDQSPQGAYLRVVIAINKGDPASFFAYIETEAQHACYTIRDYRRNSVALIRKSYPEPERTRALLEYEAIAQAADGSDVFALYAKQMGWLDRMRRDLSGVAKVEQSGDRASVQTVRGTRYPFRRRDNGIWGMTQFTAALVAEAERAARDAALVQQSAADYERAQRGAKNP